MSRERGQAAVELVALALVAAAALAGCWQVFVLERARARAELVADQAAVLIAEGRPLPPALREGARVTRQGDRIVVRVAVPGIVGDRLTASAEARLP